MPTRKSSKTHDDPAAAVHDKDVTGAVENSAAEAASGDDAGDPKAKAPSPRSTRARAPQPKQTRPKATRAKPTRKPRRSQKAKAAGSVDAAESADALQKPAADPPPQNSGGGGAGDADSDPPKPPPNVRWSFWYPSPDAAVEIQWAVGDDEGSVFFPVKVFYVQGTGERRRTLEFVESVLWEGRPELPFSLRRDSEPNAFIHGCLSWVGAEDGAQLWVQQLKYPGGFVSAEQLYPEIVDVSGGPEPDGGGTEG
ncbi:MAG: hypothetical protein AAGN66_08270 [Acidobacteriota bacterium]